MIPVAAFGKHLEEQIELRRGLDHQVHRRTVDVHPSGSSLVPAVRRIPKAAEPVSGKRKSTLAPRIVSLRAYYVNRGAGGATKERGCP